MKSIGELMARCRAMSARSHTTTALVSSAAIATLILVGGIALTGQNINSPSTSPAPEPNRTSGAGRPDAPISAEHPGDNKESSSPATASDPGPSGSAAPGPGDPFASPPPGSPAAAGSEGSVAVANTPGDTAPSGNSRRADTRTNGPAAPTIRIQVESGILPGPVVVALRVRAEDTDGFISRVEVNWNDNAPPTVINYPLSNCRIPSRQTELELTHFFGLPGDYDITATVTSTGCDGSNAQQSIGVLGVLRPALMPRL